MYFFQKIQNIVRYTILILVQISRKYLIFQHHYIVNLLCLFRKLQSIGRNTSLILVKTILRIILMKNWRTFSNKKKEKARYIIEILVQISRKYLIIKYHYSVNLMYFSQKSQNIGRYTRVILVQRRQK